jgi:hypothetical protein
MKFFGKIALLFPQKAFFLIHLTIKIACITVLKECQAFLQSSELGSPTPSPTGECCPPFREETY